MCYLGGLPASCMLIATSGRGADAETGSSCWLCDLSPSDKADLGDFPRSTAPLLLIRFVAIARPLNLLDQMLAFNVAMPASKLARSVVPEGVCVTSDFLL